MVTNCHQLKLPAADGKYYKTDVPTTEQLFRLIQSIPSLKAEPFKLWMAQVASKEKDPQHFEEHVQVAQQGGKAAEAARKQLESDLGHSVISPLNAKTGLRLNKGNSGKE